MDDIVAERPLLPTKSKYRNTQDVPFTGVFFLYQVGPGIAFLRAALVRVGFFFLLV